MGEALRFRRVLGALDLGLGALASGHVAANLATFGDSGGLAGASAQVIKLCATDITAAHDLDRIDDRRIKREDALDALTEADLADGEARAHALVGASDANALERLDAAAFAFDDFHADAKRIAGAEFGDFFVRGERFDGLALESLDQVHFNQPSYLVPARQRAVPAMRPRGARSGPAAIAVCLRPLARVATPRSSHDPPIAALRGSCALPTLQVGYNADIPEAPSRSFPPLRW